MKLKIFLEHRFQRTPDGRVWSSFFNYEMWTRYLGVFSKVTLCARVADVPNVGKEMAPATGEGVELAGLPYYHGPRQYLLKRAEFRAAVAALVTPDTAYIARVPGNVASLAIGALKARGIPYAVEVIGDPWDTFSPGSSTHPLRWLFRRSFARAARRECRESAASLYVTEHALQRRYPPAPGTPTFHASNVFLTRPAVASAASAFVEQPRPASSFTDRPLRFVCVGSFNLLYKAQDDLVRAFARAVILGLDAHLTFVGDGMYREGIEALARRQPCLQGRVEFAGQLRGGAAVREVLDRSHVFVLPSRQEGLPRAALEAMARGLPCIGSNVGGFPEILQPDAIVRPCDVAGLADCLMRLAKDPARLAEMSALNLRRASDFERDKLAVRQGAFYSTVRDLFVHFWQRNHARAEGHNSPESIAPASAGRQAA
jgi:glycosyltransferase involved in cell wall biosynthesis